MCVCSLFTRLLVSCKHACCSSLQHANGFEFLLVVDFQRTRIDRLKHETIMLEAGGSLWSYVCVCSYFSTRGRIGANAGLGLQS